MTILQHLEAIEDKDVRERAVRNCIEINGTAEEVSLYEAIMGAFNWGDSLEGFQYWSDFANSINNG